jgi:hypothetical protein
MSLDSRLRGNDTTKRVRGTRPFRWLGGVLPFAGKLRFARATYQVCAEGQSPFAGSLRVSLNSLLPLPPRMGDQGG